MPIEINYSNGLPERTKRYAVSSLIIGALFVFCWFYLMSSSWFKLVDKMMVAHPQYQDIYYIFIALFIALPLVFSGILCLGYFWRNKYPLLALFCSSIIWLPLIIFTAMAGNGFANYFVLLFTEPNFPRIIYALVLLMQVYFLLSIIAFRILNRK